MWNITPPRFAAISPLGIPGRGSAILLPDLKLEDIVRLRKPHPCGSYEWKIVRLGADIGLQCLTCGRRVLLPRRTLARRLKTIVPKSNNDNNQS